MGCTLVTVLRVRSGLGKTLRCSFEVCVDPPRPLCGKLLLGCAGLPSPLGNSVVKVLVNSRMW